MSVAPTAASSIPATGLPPIDPALEPAAIRSGNQAAKNAYSTGLAFEDMLVGELSQQLSASVPGLDGSSGGLDGSSDGLGGSSDGLDGSSDGSGGGSSALGAYSSMLPNALTSAIMTDGGTGIAYRIAQSLDPALLAPAKTPAKS